MKATKLLCPVAVGLAVVCTAASAQVIDQRGWYVGGSAGSSKAKFETSFPAVSGATVSTQTKDEAGTPYKFYLGHQFNSNLAVEGGWTDLGKFDATQNVSAPFTGSQRADVKSSGWHIDGLAIIPLQTLAAFFKIGLIHTTTKADLSTTGAAPTPAEVHRKKSELNWKFGVGASYAFTRNWAARVEYEQINNIGDASTGEMNVRMWSLGATYRF
jgi:OOP family OmpA-OmpF porin